MATINLNPTRGTDKVVYPNLSKVHENLNASIENIRPYLLRIEKYAPLLAMTPIIGNVFQIGMASINLVDAAHKKEYEKTLLLSAYIGGMILIPTPVIVITQGIVILKECNNFNFSKGLKISAIGTSMLGFATKSPQIRAVSLLLYTGHYLNEARKAINIDAHDYEQAAIYAACAGVCGADLYIHRQDLYSAIDRISKKTHKFFFEDRAYQNYLDAKQDFLNNSKQPYKAPGFLAKLLKIYKEHPEYLPENLNEEQQAHVARIMAKDTEALGYGDTVVFYRIITA